MSAASARAWYAANPERGRANSAASRLANRPSVLAKDRMRHQEAREAAAGRPRPMACEICEKPGKVHFEHCHATGVFRGWVCLRCNVVLGMVGDSLGVLQALQNYLTKNGKRK